MRLQVTLSRCGCASRRKSAELIRAGKVRVNGRVVREPGFSVDGSKDEITCSGETLIFEKKVYVVVNKPRGVITTSSDTHGRPTIFDLVPKMGACRLSHVGRLDMESSGLVILTNDGGLAYRLTHPKFEVKRVYDVTVKGSLEDAARRKLSNGVFIEGRRTHPCKIDMLKRSLKKTVVRMALHEGRKRQIRRMFEMVGHPVLRLERIKFGPLELGNLKPGAWRRLSEQEIKRLCSWTEKR